MTEPQAERRIHKRYISTTAIQLDHRPSHRPVPARCKDISRGGMMMLVPGHTPVRPGQAVGILISDDVDHAELSSLSGQDMEATVVRVDRSEFVRTGQLAIGLRFDPPIQA